MSLEDVKSTTSLGAESSASDHCNGHCLNQHQDHGVNQSEGQDEIVLDRIASLSVDKFDPSDFTGRFSKIQLRSRKRRGIINRGMWRLALQMLCVLGFFCFLLLKSTNVNEHKMSQHREEAMRYMFCNIPRKFECDCLFVMT